LFETLLNKTSDEGEKSSFPLAGEIAKPAV